MTIDTKLLELKQIQQFRKLTRDEEAELTRLQRQANVDSNWRKVFSITLAGDDGLMKLVDNTANRRILFRWADEALTPIKDIEAWFREIMKSPMARAELSWEPHLTKEQQQRNNAEDHKRSREQALAKCREYGLSECESNLQILMNNDGTIVRPTHDNKPVLWSGDNEISLVPATQEQIDTRKREFEQKKFNDRQEALAQAAASNDIATLRRIAAEEATQKHRTQFELRRDYSMLKNFITRGEKDKEPLPEYYRGKPLTADTIKKGGREVIVDLGKKHGFERLNCLLHNLPVEEFFSDAENKLRELEAEFGERSFRF